MSEKNQVISQRLLPKVKYESDEFVICCAVVSGCLYSDVDDRVV